MKILLTREYGAGWSTWADRNDVADFVLTYQPIIDYLEALENAGKDNDLHEKHPLILKLLKDIKDKFGTDTHFYVGGCKSLYVDDVHKPSLVEMLRIRDYDGRETLYGY